MSKASRGGTRIAAGKKKAKRRLEPQPITQMPPSTAAQEPVQTSAPTSDQGSQGSGAAVLQFRPRAREVAAARSAGRGAAPAKALLQAVDYSYVYTDLKIIGGLTAFLLGVLIVLTLVVH